MKTRFTDEQIIQMIKEKTAGGMEPSDAMSLRALEAENAKLKKLLVEQLLENALLRDVNAKMC